METTVAEIAKKIGGAVEGDENIRISAPADIRNANSEQISFVSNPRYAPAAESTRAGAVIVAKDWDRPCPATLIRVDNPDKAFASAASLFAKPPVAFKPGIHASAVVDNTASIGQDVFIGPHCVIEENAVIGDNCVIYAGCYIGHGVEIGKNCKLYPNVSIREYAKIGNRTIIHNGTVIGSDGFGYVEEGDARQKVPQNGIVVIGEDVEIGANTTIDRARFGETRIGNGVKIDNLVQIAHNVHIGDNSVVVAQVGISGSTCIGEHVIIAGQAGLTGHLTIGSNVVIGAQSGVNKDVPPGTFVLGSPAYRHDKTKKIFATLARLPALKQELIELKAKIAKYEKKFLRK